MAKNQARFYAFMYSRRIQLTGKASYVVTLPIDWVKMHKIKKKQEIKLIKQGDGSLLLTPSINSAEHPRTKQFTYTKKTDLDHLSRSFYAAYLVGFDQIEIVSKEMIPQPVREKIIALSKNLMGLQPGEMDRNKIQFKNVVERGGISFFSTLTDMMTAVISMYKFAIQCLEEAEPSYRDFVKNQDKEINRHNYYIIRLMNSYLQDLSLSQTLALNLVEAQSHFATGLYLEILADFACMIVEDMTNIIAARPIPSFNSEIVKLGKSIIAILEQITSNVPKRHLGSANADLDAIAKLQGDCERMKERLATEDGHFTYHVLIERFLRTLKLTSNLALITIDLVEASVAPLNTTSDS